MVILDLSFLGEASFMVNFLIEAFFGILIGTSLGLLGGGGATLAIPVLTYALNIPAKESIFMSMGLVGLSSMVGVIEEWRKKRLRKDVIVVFGPLSIIGTLLGTRLASLITAEAQMLLFSILAVIASYRMIRGNHKLQDPQAIHRKVSVYKLAPLGFIVGLITGLVGVGGGFLIVPTLTLIAGLPFYLAVGSSLALITINMASGFLFRLFSETLNWEVFIPFLFFSSLGVFFSRKLTHLISEAKLKKGFGYLLLVIGVLVMIKNKHIL